MGGEGEENGRGRMGGEGEEKGRGRRGVELPNRKENLEKRKVR